MSYYPAGKSVASKNHSSKLERQKTIQMDPSQKDDFWLPLSGQDLGFLKHTLKDMHPELAPLEAPLTEDVNDTLVREVLSICSQLGLKVPTRHLAIFIGNHFLRDPNSNIKGSYLRSKEVAQGAILVAAKMKEKDIDFPMISNIINASRHPTTSRELKSVEIELNVKFGWNYAFRTFYDYLETFLILGTFTSSDIIMTKSVANSPISDIRLAEGARLARCPSLGETDIYSKENNYKQETALEENTKSPKGPSIQGLDVPILKTWSTPSTFPDSIAISTIENQKVAEIQKSVRKESLALSDQVSISFLSCPKLQKLLAYAIIAFVRKIHGFLNFDSQEVKKNYAIENLTLEYQEKLMDMIDQLEILHRKNKRQTRASGSEKYKSRKANSSSRTRRERMTPISSPTLPPTRTLKDSRTEPSIADPNILNSKPTQNIKNYEVNKEIEFSEPLQGSSNLSNPDKSLTKSQEEKEKELAHQSIFQMYLPRKQCSPNYKYLHEENMIRPNTENEILQEPRTDIPSLVLEPLKIVEPLESRIIEEISSADKVKQISKSHKKSKQALSLSKTKSLNKSSKNFSHSKKVSEESSKKYAAPLKVPSAPIRPEELMAIANSMKKGSCSKESSKDKTNRAKLDSKTAQSEEKSKRKHFSTRQSMETERQKLLKKVALIKKGSSEQVSPLPTNETKPNSIGIEDAETTGKINRSSAADQTKKTISNTAQGADNTNNASRSKLIDSETSPKYKEIEARLHTLINKKKPPLSSRERPKTYGDASSGMNGRDRELLTKKWIKFEEKPGNRSTSKTKNTSSYNADPRMVHKPESSQVLNRIPTDKSDSGIGFSHKYSKDYSDYKEISNFKSNLRDRKDYPSYKDSSYSNYRPGTKQTVQEKPPSYFRKQSHDYGAPKKPYNSFSKAGQYAARPPVHPPNTCLSRSKDPSDKKTTVGELTRANPSLSQIYNSRKAAPSSGNLASHTSAQANTHQKGRYAQMMRQNSLSGIREVALYPTNSSNPSNTAVSRNKSSHGLVGRHLSNLTALGSLTGGSVSIGANKSTSRKLPNNYYSSSGKYSICRK